MAYSPCQALLIMEEILRNLKNYIEKEIQKGVSKETRNIDKYDEFVKDLLDSISTYKDTTKEILKECDEENLTFNKIENEGFLRCLITIESEIMDGLKYVNDNCA